MRDAVPMDNDTSPLGNQPTPPSSNGEEDLTVGQVAAMCGVTVRALHHWDQIGLCSPSARSWSGYRLYTPGDVERLQLALVYRETGMPLSRITRLLEEPADTAEHLVRQRSALVERICHLQRMVRAVDAIMEKNMTDTPMSAQDRARALGDSWSLYEDEAAEKWGDTDAWAQASARRAALTPQEWSRITAEVDALEWDLAQAMTRGVQPGCEEANALAERHRASLDQWFDTTHERHVLVSRGYTADPRFATHYDARVAGLAAWLVEVIEANARAHGVDPDTATWDSNC